jgi:hypothetical protein
MVVPAYPSARAGSLDRGTPQGRVKPSIPSDGLKYVNRCFGRSGRFWRASAEQGQRKPQRSVGRSSRGWPMVAESPGPSPLPCLLCHPRSMRGNPAPGATISPRGAPCREESPAYGTQRLRSLHRFYLYGRVSCHARAATKVVAVSAILSLLTVTISGGRQFTFAGQKRRIKRCSDRERRHVYQLLVPQVRLMISAESRRGLGRAR